MISHFSSGIAHKCNTQAYVCAEMKHNVDFLFLFSTEIILIFIDDCQSHTPQKNKKMSWIVHSFLNREVSVRTLFKEQR